MADVLELVFSDTSEEKLWAHGLRLDDAIAVIDGGDFRTFRDPRRPTRRLVIGRASGGRLVTLVIEPQDETGLCLLITGWPSSRREESLFERPGGTKYAGRP